MHMTDDGSISRKPRRLEESEVEGVLPGAPPAPGTSDEGKVDETKAESNTSKATPPEPSTESDTGAERSVQSPPGPEVKVPEEDADDSLERAAFTFPARLMELLEGGVEKEALWWLDGGDCFCVVPKIFAERVLNKYFQSTKFESFTRKLNRWYVKIQPMRVYQHEGVEHASQ
jgi:HSF-type DNA-binding